MIWTASAVKVRGQRGFESKPRYGRLKGGSTPGHRVLHFTTLLHLFLRPQPLLGRLLIFETVGKDRVAIVELVSLPYMPGVLDRLLEVARMRSGMRASICMRGVHEATPWAMPGNARNKGNRKGHQDTSLVPQNIDVSVSGCLGRARN